MKKILLIISLVFASFADVKAEEESLSETFSMYKGFDYGNSVNWSDCFDWDIKWLPFDWCPGGFLYPPYLSIPTTHYSYYDLVAMVEVVPDPWRSYLYDESPYDFSGKSENRVLNKVGVSKTIGSGYTGGGKNDATTEQAQFKFDTHVWAISDWWRFATSSPWDGCLSLVCQNEDQTFCVASVKKTVANVSQGTKDMVASINSDQSAGAKGQGIETGSGQYTYENGEVWQEKVNENGSSMGYQQIRGPGNYGDDVFGRMADVAMSDSIIPGMNNAEMLMNGIALAEDPKGYVAGKAISVGADMASEYYEENYADTVNETTERWTNELKGGVASLLPESTTKTNGKDTPAQSEPAPLTSTPEGSDASSAGNAVSNNALGTNSAGNSQAFSQISGAISSAGMNKMFSIIDRVTFFNVIELAQQMIAMYMPIMLHPVYMSERHKKATSDGGFFWSPIMKQFADMGAGLVMPLFCMAKTLGMGIDSLADLMMSSDFNLLSSLGPIGSFIENRCVGSWGPLEPRVSLMGAGDPFVAAGLASVRGLNIAQSITGSEFNKTINNTPFTRLKFNLEFPHKSKCYSFAGAEGLSRGWTTPVAGVFDGVQDVIKNNGEGAGSLLADSTIGHAQKQGGYVFTYWRKRKCRYLWDCDKWRGDTGK